LSRFLLNVVVVVVVVVGGLAISGCPSLPPPVVPEPTVTEVEADPLLLLAERTEFGIEVEEVDAGELLARAAAQAEDGDFLGAAQAYEEIARQFAGSSAEREALYREGVCLEWADDWTGALVTFRRRLALAGTGPLGPDELPALIHSALLAERLELWSDAADGYARLLESDTLSPGDRRAATVRLAVVKLEQGDKEAARPMLEQVVADSVAAFEAGEPVHPAPSAEAEIRLGLLESERLAEVRLDSPQPAEVRRQVQKLADVFGAAFDRLAAAVRGGSAFWAVEAGYRIGALYMDIYNMFFDAPVPTQLDAGQRDMYEALLRAQTRILLANAAAAWEENVVRAERTGVRGEAVELSAAGIERIEEILKGREEHRTELDDMAEDFLEAHGQEDPLAPLLDRIETESPSEEPGPEPSPAPEGGETVPEPPPEPPAAESGRAAPSSAELPAAAAPGP
jgi:hypothetical protein